MGADMELVRQFNSEMASIYESKPPISKAKMASITRFAVKALKYYKHIAHAVEKFLQKITLGSLRKDDDNVIVDVNKRVAAVLV